MKHAFWLDSKQGLSYHHFFTGSCLCPASNEIVLRSKAPREGGMSQLHYVPSSTNPPSVGNGHPAYSAGERTERCFSNVQVKSLPWGWEKTRMSLLQTGKGRREGKGQRKNTGESSWDILPMGMEASSCPTTITSSIPITVRAHWHRQRVRGCLAAQAGCCSPWFLTASRSDLQLQQADTMNSNSCIF